MVLHQFFLSNLRELMRLNGTNLCYLLTEVKKFLIKLKNVAVAKDFGRRNLQASGYKLDFLNCYRTGEILLLQSFPVKKHEI
jgi:hypothetical protein